MKVYRWAWRLVPSVKTSMSYLYVFIGISYDQLWFGVGSAQRSVIEHDSIAKEFVNLTQVLNLPAVAGSECLKCQVWASYFDKAAEQNLTGLATTFTHNISHNINIYIYICYIYQTFIHSGAAWSTTLWRCFLEKVAGGPCFQSVPL